MTEIYRTPEQQLHDWFADTGAHTTSEITAWCRSQGAMSGALLLAMQESGCICYDLKSDMWKLKKAIF